MNASPFPRLVRPAADPLALYFRAGRNDHVAMNQLLSSGHSSFFGVVVEAGRVARHKELIELADKKKLECILDPTTQPSATQGGYTKDHARLPWGLNRPHIVSDFQAANQKSIVAALGDFAGSLGFSQLLAPTHLIRDAQDEWLAADIETCHSLRDYLDRNGKRRVGIIYSLSLPYATFRDESKREQIISALQGVPAQSVWLRVDGFGSDSSPAAVSNYIEAAGDFHELGLPIVCDQVGGLVGLTLLAFSATGGLTNGVTVGERFNTQHWRRPSKPSQHMLHPRVYFPTLDLYLKPKEAQALMDRSGRFKSQFCCNDSECCPRGALDMVQTPSRHFMIQRMKQVSALSRIPEQLRSREFVEQYIRPTTDQVLRVSGLQQLNEALHKRLVPHRKRLDALRVMLGKRATATQISHSEIPATRAAREARL